MSAGAPHAAQGPIPGRISRLLLTITAVAVVCGCVTFIFYLALNRLVGRDEGYYLAASVSTLSGNIPYLDFFYPQMPLLPYVYGAFFKVLGVSWSAGRIVSALLTLWCVLLVFRLCRVRCSLPGSLFGMMLFTCSAQSFPWFVAVQTYALSTACLLGSVSCVLFYAVTRTRWALCVSGALAGCAVMTRLPLAPAAAVLALYIYLADRGAPTRRGVNLFAAAFGLSLTPVLLLALMDPGAFYFNNLGYHFMRTTLSGEELDMKRWRVIELLTGFARGERIDSFQFPLLFWIAVFEGITAAARRRLPDPALAIGAVLFVVHLLPSPTYAHYFGAVVPFLIPSIVAFLEHSAALCFQAPIRYVGTAAGFALIFGFSAVYFARVDRDLLRYTVTGDQVIGIGASTRDTWKIKTIKAAAKAADGITTPGEMVYASWPGLLVGSHAVPVPGTENHFGVALARTGRLTPELRSRYRITAPQQVVEMIRSGAVRTAMVIGRPGMTSKLEERLRALGLEPVRTIELIKIFQPAAGMPRNTALDASPFGEFELELDINQ